MRFPCFADDYQGLAAATLAAALGAVPHTGIDLQDHRILILGNGPHRVAIAEMLVSAIASEAKVMGWQARQNIYLADDDGLVTATSPHVNREHEETREVLLYSKDIEDADVVEEVRRGYLSPPARAQAPPPPSATALSHLGGIPLAARLCHRGIHGRASGLPVHGAHCGSTLLHAVGLAGVYSGWWRVSSTGCGGVQIVDMVKPTMLISCSSSSRTMRPISDLTVRRMSMHTQRPVLFALSSPRPELSAAQAYHWSDGRAIYANFEAEQEEVTTPRGNVLTPSKVQSVYIFPGLSMGVCVARSLRIKEDQIIAAARTVAGMLTSEDVELGRVLPPVSKVHDVAKQVALTVARTSYEYQIATALPKPTDLEAVIEATMHDPNYIQFG